MRRQLLRVTLVATTLLLAGCATLQVSSHTDRGLVWSKYKTFDWGPADAQPAGDPRLDKDPFFQDHVAGAIERAMAGHGFALSAVTERPDVVIHYHANVAERLDVDQIDRGYGRCISDDCGPRVSRHEAGTLVVDIVDAETNVLIWRGWAQGSLDGVLGNRDRLGRRIEDSVTQMFETLRPVR
jgi:hypothetical protein